MQVEQLRESLKVEIRRELKIKEGAENLRKVSTDKKTLAQCNQAIKQSNAKLDQLHHELQEVNARLSDEILTIGQTGIMSSFCYLLSLITNQFMSKK